MSFTADTSQLSAAIRRLSALNNKTQSENLRGVARTTLRNPQGTGIIDMTPPASPKTKGGAAKKQGEAAIDRDLANVFAGVRGKGIGPRAPSDPDVIHRRLFRGKRAGSPMRSDIGKGNRYFVDLAALKELGRRLKARVGRMAATWMASANKLGVSVPAWIARHGTGPGSCTVELRAPRYQISMEALPLKGTPYAELERRVTIALGYSFERLKRAIAGTQLVNDAKAAGFKAIK